VFPASGLENAQNLFKGLLGKWYDWKIAPQSGIDRFPEDFMFELMKGSAISPLNRRFKETTIGHEELKGIFRKIKKEGLLIVETCPLRLPVEQPESPGRNDFAAIVSSPESIPSLLSTGGLSKPGH
jgi:hypothetical protein